MVGLALVEIGAYFNLATRTSNLFQWMGEKLSPVIRLEPAIFMMKILGLNHLTLNQTTKMLLPHAQACLVTVLVLCQM